MKIQIYNTKGQWVGDFDTEQKTYYSQRDAAKGQVFHHFGNAIAVDVYILKQLLSKEAKFICILILNFEGRPSFYVLSTINNFIENSEKFNYDKRNEYGQSYTGYGEQSRMPMLLWRRANSIKEVGELMHESLVDYV